MWRALGVMLLLASAAFGQTVTVPDKLEVKTGRLARVEITYDGKDPRYVIVGKDVDSFQEHTSKPNVIVLRILAYEDQKIALIAWCVKGDVSSEPGECLITASGGKPPTPTPTPDPKPPTPNPDDPVIAPPIPDAGFRVLILQNTADLTKLPPSQNAILTSGVMRAYLNSHCITGPDGKLKEWRIWDAAGPFDAESQLWQTATKRKRDSVPWIVISNGKTGFEGPLPKTIDETMTLLEKYGGK